MLTERGSFSMAYLAWGGPSRTENRCTGRGRSRLKTASTRDSTMPRYYFHLTDGNQVLNNHKGIDLSGNATARTDALALARDLKNGAVMSGWNWTGWFVTIVDQHGHTVDKVPIADV